MKKIIMDKIMNNITKYYNYSDTKLKEIRYGLESLYLSIFKLIVVIIINILIHTIKELCLFLVFYGLLRLTAFGLHAKKTIHCWISSIAIFVGIPLSIKYISIPYNIIVAISIICLIAIVIYAPADTEKRPLINVKKRLIFKIFSIIFAITYIIIISITKSNYLQHILLCSLLLESLLILPISYKLFGVKYNNYLLYQKKGGLK